VLTLSDLDRLSKKNKKEPMKNFASHDTLVLDFTLANIKSATEAKVARAHGLAGIRPRAQQLIRSCRPLLEWLCEDGPIKCTGSER
jgi:hypothetical protein